MMCPSPQRGPQKPHPTPQGMRPEALPPALRPVRLDHRQPTPGARPEAPVGAHREGLHPGMRQSPGKSLRETWMGAGASAGRGPAGIVQHRDPVPGAEVEASRLSSAMACTSSAARGAAGRMRVIQRDCSKAPNPNPSGSGVRRRRPGGAEPDPPPAVPQHGVHLVVRETAGGADAIEAGDPLPRVVYPVVCPVVCPVVSLRSPRAPRGLPDGRR